MHACVRARIGMLAFCDGLLMLDRTLRGNFSVSITHLTVPAVSLREGMLSKD